jgi:thymidylate synthase
MLTTSDIRQQFADLYKNKEFVQDKTGVKLLEIAPAHFIADDDTIFGEVNHAYINVELRWYNTMKRNINTMEAPIPQLWKSVAGKTGYVNSNYGWCVWTAENHNQFDNCLYELQNNHTSRRAVMIYTRPNIHHDMKHDGANDFICTNVVQYMIRQDKLHAYVQMRSNDAWAGYRNDLAWQKHVHTQLADQLEIELGTIYWTATSLHIYERQFHLVDKFIETGVYR